MTPGKHRVVPDAGGRRAMAGRLSWGLGDQAVSSLTNFVVGIYVARSLGPAEFGIFTLAWVTYGVVLNVSRGIATDPLVVRFSGVPTSSWRAAVSRASGTALLVGIAAGVLNLLAGVTIGGELGGAFVALGLVLPALLVQDSWRFAFFAAGHGRKAFVNDVVWAAALIPALVFVSGSGSVSAFVLAWGLSAAVAAALGGAQAGMPPRWSGTRGWLLEQRDLGPRYLLENVSNSGASQLRMYGIGAIAGLVDVGAIRGAELLLGPFLAVLMGLSLVAVPEAARLVRRSPHRLRQFCLFLGAAQAVTALAWGMALLFLLPEVLGRWLLDAVWEPASELVLPVTLSVAGAGFVAGAAAGLRALGAARRSLRSQLFASTMYLGGGLAGAAVAGALGATWGSATAMWLGAAIWWGQLGAGLREHVTDPQPVDEEMSTP